MSIPLIWIKHPTLGEVNFPISELTYHTGWEIDHQDGLLLGMTFWEEHRLEGVVVKRSAHVRKTQAPDMGVTQGSLGGGPQAAPDDPIKPVTFVTPL